MTSRCVLNSCGDLRADTWVVPTTTLLASISGSTVFADVVLLQADKASPRSFQNLVPLVGSCDNSTLTREV